MRETALSCRIFKRPLKNVFKGAGEEITSFSELNASRKGRRRMYVFRPVGFYKGMRVRRGETERRRHCLNFSQPEGNPKAKVL